MVTLEPSFRITRGEKHAWRVGLAALPGIFLSLRIRTMVDDVQSALSRVEGRVVGASLKVNLVLLAVAAIVVERHDGGRCRHSHVHFE